MPQVIFLCAGVKAENKTFTIADSRFTLYDDIDSLSCMKWILCLTMGVTLASNSRCEKFSKKYPSIMILPLNSRPFHRSLLDTINCSVHCELNIRFQPFLMHLLYIYWHISYIFQLKYMRSEGLSE